MKSKSCIIIAILFALLSCEKNHNTRQLRFEVLKGTWSFVKFIDKTTQQTDSLPKEYSAVITFYSNYTIAVKGPCNSGSGKFTIKENNIMISQLAMTERACDALNKENKFTANLSGNYSIEGNTLTILSDFDTDLVFIKAK